VKFLIDAQLPRRLALWLQFAGYDATHTLDLPTGNQTTDETINTLSFQNNYIVITKDADFVNSFVIQHKPYKLLLISTGNITNYQLELIFQQNIQQIANLFKTHEFIELNQTSIIIHM
jgi:predicted nuclease of predicted toxin-antitoxin system